MGWLQDLTGQTAAKAATRAGQIQTAAANQAAVDIGLSEQEQLAALQQGMSNYQNTLQQGQLAQQGTLQQGQLAQQATLQQGQADYAAALRQGQLAQQATLDPFNQFGQGMMGMANDAFAQQQALMGQGGADQVMNSPMFQALLAKSQQDIMSNQAARGRMGTGETPMFMQDAALRTGYDVLQGERQAALANTQSLMNPINLGFGAAGQIGQGQINTAGQIGQGIFNTAGQIGQGQYNTAGQIGQSQFNTANQIGQGQYNLGQNQAQTMMNSILGQTGYRTDAAAAQAGGVVGRANAQSSGIGNLVGLGVGALTGGLGAGVGGMVGKGLDAFGLRPSGTYW